MKPLPEFLIPESGVAARALQDILRSKIIVKDDFARIDLIAGIDVGYDNVNNLAHASVVSMKLTELKTIEQVQAFVPVEFPYITGLLAFREIPAILAALTKLEATPDLLMVDGMGIAHPRRMGIAAHLGLLLDMPSIGVGKTRLTGKYEMPGPCRGENSPLMDKGERIGTVLRSRDNVAPLFISPGHRVGMDSALEITMSCLTKYRLPEPTRMADKLSKCKISKTGNLI